MAQDAAVLCSSVSLDGGIRKAGWYWAGMGKGKQRKKGIKIWAMSDLDTVGTWTVGRDSIRDITVSSPI